LENNQLLQTLARACDDKRAENIIAMDMHEVSLIADSFLICSGSNERQVQAIARAVREAADENGVEVKRMEGFDQARWILLDVGEVICHIFHKDERVYYNLERLWGDAPHIELAVNADAE